MEKMLSYMGFAARAGKLAAGTNTCLMMIRKRKVKLLLIASELSENSKEKLIREAVKTGTDYRICGNTDQIAQITGKDGKCVFALTDEGFAKSVLREIDSESGNKEGSDGRNQ